MCVCLCGFTDFYQKNLYVFVHMYTYVCVYHENIEILIKTFDYLYITRIIIIKKLKKLMKKKNTSLPLMISHHQVDLGI